MDAPDECDDINITHSVGVVAGPSKHNRLVPSEDADALPVARRLQQVRPEGRGIDGKEKKATRNETKRIAETKRLVPPFLASTRTRLVLSFAKKKIREELISRIHGGYWIRVHV